MTDINEDYPYSSNPEVGKYDEGYDIGEGKYNSDYTGEVEGEGGYGYAGVSGDTSDMIPGYSGYSYNEYGEYTPGVYRAFDGEGREGGYTSNEEGLDGQEVGYDYNGEGGGEKGYEVNYNDGAAAAGEEGKYEEYYNEVSPFPYSSEPVWSAFDDGEGNIFYYNNVSGESVWDKPDGFDESLRPKSHSVEEGKVLEGGDSEKVKETSSEIRPKKKGKKAEISPEEKKKLIMDGIIRSYIEKFSDRVIYNGKLDGYAIMREAYKSGPEAVAGIMLTSDRIDIMKWGCWNIGKMALDKKYLKNLVESGCMVAVIRSLQMFNDSSTVQSQAIIAIACSSELDDVRSHLMQLHVLPTVCQCLHRVEALLNDRDEQEINNGVTIAVHGLQLFSLYYNDERIRNEAVSHGLQEIMATMRSLVNDTCVIVAGANSLKYFCHEDPYLRDFAANAGAIELLDYFYTTYSSDDVVRRALKASLAELEGGLVVIETPRDRSTNLQVESPRSRRLRNEREFLAIRSEQESRAVEEYKAEVLALKQKIYSRFSYTSPEVAAKMGLTNVKNEMEANNLAGERREANSNCEKKLRVKKEKHVLRMSEFTNAKSEKESHDKAKQLMSEIVKQHRKGVLKKDIDALFEANGFNQRRYEQVFDELEIEGMIYAGGYNLIMWDGPVTSDEEEDGEDDG